MSLVNSVQNLATRIGEEIKVVRSEAVAIASARYTKSETDAAISAAIDDVLSGAPGALDTLNELAAALGNDANFASTIASQIAAKADTATVNSALALKADASSVVSLSQVNTAISTAIAPLAVNPRLTLNLQTSTGSVTTDPVIAGAMSTIGTTNGFTVNLGFGEYRETGPVLIDNKWQLQIVGPQAASTTAATIKNGITIQNSNGVRLTRVQVEGTSAIACRAGLGHHFQRAQFMGNLTLSGTGGFMMFTDCEFAGDITVAPTFAGVVYFFRCSFAKANGVYTFGQSSPLQVIVADSSGIPNAGFSKASYSGMVSYKNNSQAFFSNGVAISTAGATSGKILKHNGTAFVPADDISGGLPLTGGTITGDLVVTDMGVTFEVNPSLGTFYMVDGTGSNVEGGPGFISVVDGSDTSGVIAQGGTVSIMSNVNTKAAALPTLPEHATTKVYVDDAVALKANSADVYTKAEVDALASDTGDITFEGKTLLGANNEVRLAARSTTTTGTFSLIAGVDYSTAVWDGDSVTFNDTTEALYNALWALTGQFDIIDLVINGSTFRVTSTGSSTPGVPQAAALFLNESAVGGPLDVSAVQIEARSGTESYVEIDGSDFRVDVQDDIRIYANDVFRLRNRSAEASINIETNDGEHSWEFSHEGHLILPNGGEIRDENGNNVLSNVQIDDETTSSTSVFSSSKIDGMIGDASTDFVATFEAALV